MNSMILCTPNTFEHGQSTFQAHAIHVYSTTEAGLALDAIHQKPDIGAVDHMMYVYRFIDESGEIKEGYSDDGKVRGSMEIRRVLDRTVRRNIFVCVTREHKGANIGQKRFDLIRQAAESAISKLVPNINK